MNVNQLTQAANMTDVMNAVGVKIKRKGEYYFVKCPDRAHDDKHPTNCFFKDGQNFCYCAVCDKRFDAIDVIRNVTGLGFKNAANRLWEIEGRPEWYDGKNDNDHHLLTCAELDCANIVLNRAMMPVAEAPRRLVVSGELPGRSFSREKEFYRIFETCQTFWYQFFTESQMKGLIRKRCCRKAEELKELGKLLPGIERTKAYEEQQMLLGKLRRWADG